MSFVLFAGCTGNLETADTAGTTPGAAVPTDMTGAPPVTVPGDPATGDPVVPPAQSGTGPRFLTRLTNNQYDNTIRDLLGDDSRPGTSFVDDKPREFGFRRLDRVAVQDAEVLRGAAQSIAASAVGRLGQILACDPAQTGEAQCAQNFVEVFGMRAYRHPLSAAEQGRLMALYDKARNELKLSFDEAIGTLIEAMLQSPSFLYHWSAPDAAKVSDGATLTLDAYEVASRMSYLVWESMPDDALLQAAGAGELATDAGIAAATRRLLADPKAREGLGTFFLDWLDLSQLDNRTKDPEAYPNYDDALRASMFEETRSFVQNVLFEGGGSLATLLTADYSFVNGALDGIYQSGAAAGDTLTKVSLNPTQRLGLLTQPTFLAATGNSAGSNPVRRGHTIYTKLLCETLPPPPNDVPAPAPPEAGGTTRERFAAHGEQECAGCHRLFDQFGFAFEHYDGIGQYRTMDNGGVVDASGQVDLDGQKQSFADAIGLVGILAQSPKVHNCVSRQWLRYALSRDDVPADQAELDQLTLGFEAAGLDIRELIVAITASHAFRFRSLSEGELL